MATEGEEKVGYSLATVGTVKLEKTIDEYPNYISIVVCQDKIVVLDRDTYITYKVKIHRLHDGKCLASDRLESGPRDMCLMDAMTICVLDGGGLIQMMSIDSTDMSPVFTTTRRLRLQGVLERYDSVVRFNNNLVVTGERGGMMCWCIVSLHDGHVDSIHQICKGDGLWSRVTTKDTIIYISCHAGYKSPDNTGVYGFDILNPSQCKYTYKHQHLQVPTSIVINEDGNIFVCNGYPDACIHQLTASCQLVAIFTQEIPWHLYAIFWDNGRMYGTCWGSSDITVFQPVYQGSHKASEVLVSNERKQPVIEETAIQIGQGNVPVDQGQSSVPRELPPSGKVPEDSQDDKQDPVIPVEILRMDDKSLQLYKNALRDGKEKIYNIRVMVVGQFGVGKTTLTKRLLGKPVYITERKSTEGIDVYKHCCKISLDTGEWIVQLEDSDQLSRLQRLMKLLSGPDQKSNVSQEQEGHREVVYERETTPEADNTQMSEAASSSRSDQENQLTYSQPAKLSAIKKDGGHGMGHSDQETSTVTVTKSEAESSNKVRKDAVIEILHLINENADKLEKDIVRYAALSIWDFAGQYAFYTTHQTFLSSRALYLLVIDLNQQITDLIKDDKCFLDMEGIKLCKVHDLVEIWMNSIHTCASSPEASIPHVVLVGTHVDKLSEKSRKEVIDKYFKKLRYILKDKPTIRHLMDDIAIDNTQSDPMLEILKRKIFELASQQPHWGEERPARWLPLEQAIMTLKASGAKVVAHSLIEEINMSGSVRIEDSDELDLFLKFHHEMGTILYFSVEGLREKIVLDAQWLIDALKSLITAETFIKKYPAITSKWYEFEETGKLAHELIDAIWTEKNNQEFRDNKDHILLLMEKLNIIAKPRSFTEDGNIKEEDYYLAPCMLHQATPAEIISPESNPEMESTSVICFVSTGHFLPPPVFHRLLGSCLAQWPIAKQKSKNLIYCGSCVFNLDPLHRLTLYFRDYVIFVQVTRIKIADIRLSSNLCSEARNFIFGNLSKIIGNLGQSCQFEVCVRCPDSEVDSLDGLIAVSLLQTYEKVPCHSHDRSHTLASRELLKFWYKDEEQSNAGSKVNNIKKKAKHQISEKPSTNKRKRKRNSVIIGPVAKRKSNNSQSDIPDKAEITDVTKSKKTGVSCSDPELLCQVLKKSTQVASSSRSTLEGNCRTVGLKFHGETPGNGNCFFEAVSSQLQRLNCAVQKSPQQLREDVVAFMKANTVLQGSEGTINLAEFISNGNFNDYCERMAQDGEWADHVVIVGMARMLLTDIMIVTSAPSSGPENNIAWVVGQNNFNGQPILLGHIWENHYQSLQPIGDNKAPEVLRSDETINHVIFYPDHEGQQSNEGKQPVREETATQTEQEAEHSEDGPSAVPMPPGGGDTDRFMRLTYLLVDVGSRILRQLLSHHIVTPTCTLDQYLAKNKGTINSLLKRKVLHQSQMDILFPPNGGNTNLEDYDVTLLSALFNNIVPSLTQQEEGMIKSLREDRNKLYGHAKSCKMNAMEYQTCWNSISSTLITLSQQCGDPNFQNEISQEIQRIQVSAIPTGSYLDILKTWFSTIDTVKGSLDTVKGSLDTVKGSLETVKGSLETAEGAIQALTSRVEALETKKTAADCEGK